MSILALDLSLTALGWAMNAPVRSGIWKPPHRGVERLAAILGWLNGMLDGVGLVCVEGYSFGSQGRAVVSLGELGGVVRLHLYQRGLPFVEVPPSCRAKLATGKGNAGKDEVLAAAIRRLGYEGHDHNASDALWLLQAALVHYGLPGAVDLPQSHRDALTKIEWPKDFPCPPEPAGISVSH